ncbi:MAG TPA: hypothetical protein VN903_28430 [Polyangia bacterium]|nr:hypothetical protein [Polyangia bacterium]
MAAGLATVGATDGDRIRGLIRQRYIPQPAPRVSLPDATASVTTGPSGVQMQPASRDRYAGMPAPAPAAPAAVTNWKNPGDIIRPPVVAGAPNWNRLNQSGNSLPGNINFGSGFMGTINDILRNYLGGGAYSDQPNQAILDSVLSLALGDAGAARDRAVLQAENLGSDPASMASYGAQADLQGQGDVAHALNSASLGELTHQRDFGQSLLMALLGGQGKQNEYNPTSGAQWVNAIANLVGAANPYGHH